MTQSRFLDLPDASLADADVALLPLPYEGTVSFGHGTARAPAAIWEASKQVELFDELTGFELNTLRFHSASAVTPAGDEDAASYLGRVEESAKRLHRSGGLVLGVGGEHSLTPALVRAAAGDDLSSVTVVQIDAHLDMRESWNGNPLSHACAMKRLVDHGATVIGVGIRAVDRDEVKFAAGSRQVEFYYAHELITRQGREQELIERLAGLSSDVYLTIDVDGLEVHLCPGTGTPEPGGLGWWQTLVYLRTLLHGSSDRLQLVGADVVEAVPVSGSQVNQVTAARLLAKVIAFRFDRRED